MLSRLGKNLGSKVLKQSVRTFSEEASKQVAKELPEAAPATIKPPKFTWTTGKVIGAMTTTSLVTSMVARKYSNQKLLEQENLYHQYLQEQDTQNRVQKDTFKQLFRMCAQNPVLSKNIDNILSYGDFFVDQRHMNALLYRLSSEARINNRFECFEESTAAIKKKSPKYFEAVSLGATYPQAEKMQHYQLEAYVKLRNKGMTADSALRLYEHEMSLVGHFMQKAGFGSERAIEATRGTKTSFDLCCITN